MPDFDILDNCCINGNKYMATWLVKVICSTVLSWRQQRYTYSVLYYSTGQISVNCPVLATGGASVNLHNYIDWFHIC